ncbi:Hypothetical protein I5071_88970 [Sandaracinus amylolyticus]|nr:Hypothetical protein I5071_88970 [Sandaracinus amylolyticus]
MGSGTTTGRAQKSTGKRRATNGGSTAKSANGHSVHANGDAKANGARQKRNARDADVEPATSAAPVERTRDSERLVPVKARPSRSEREFAEQRAQEIDDVCAAWAAIVAERMAADQQFAESYEQFQKRPRDLRGLFLWDQLHAAESHVAMVNAVIAKHLEGRRADPFAILTDLRAAQRKLAVVYAVNAFLAVLNQMSPSKPKWLTVEALDPRMAVLALAHQTLEYALEAARIEAPADLTEQILAAAQDESVWTGARDASDRTLAACAATAAFFRTLGAQDLATIDEIVTLYETHAKGRDVRAF